MKIVADENIPLLDEFFSDICQSNLITLAGRDMCQADLVDADILLVRSITQVNEALLKGTNIKFVGTCTIGTDHLDMDYLQAKNIRFSNAPGCNAQAVVEYVLSSLITLGERKQVNWRALSVGVVGAGNVGGLLYKTLKALQVNVHAYDPNVAKFASEDHSTTVWQQDVVSLHTPITQEGDNKTLHLVNTDRLNSMKENACIINSCRGAVVDNAALSKHLESHPEFMAVMDVWEDEPAPNDYLIKQCLLATPHIAGYSLDGKYLGTAMIYEAVCEFLALPIRMKLPQLVPQGSLRKISTGHEAKMPFILNKVIRSGYDVRDDHFRMLSLLGLTDHKKAQAFDVLRKQYPLRRDLNTLTLSAKRLSQPDWLSAVGVKIKP